MSPGCRDGRGSSPTALQIVGESVRLRLGDPLPSSPWFDGARLAVTAARGEIIGLQIFHGGGPVRLQVPSTIRARTYAVEAFDVVRPSTALYGGSQGAGRYPDGLVERDAPDTNPVYLELEATASGTGALIVDDRTVPLGVTVAPVTLPPLTRQVWAYGNPYELAWTGADEAACVARFAAYGVALSPDVHLEDLPARRAGLADLRDVPVWISDEPAEAAAQVRGFVAAFAGSGQVPFAIPIDEPRTPGQRQAVVALAEAVRAAGGGPTTFRFAVTDEPRPEYRDLVDLYISPRAAHLTGDRVARWTYNGAPPAAGAMVLDAASPGLRTWGWIAWRWQIPTWYVWDATYWHDRHNRKRVPLPARGLDLARDPVSFDDGEDHGNLDGALALPGCRPTLRLAQLRRGLQDRALLALAAACDRPAAEAIAARLVPRALADAGPAPAWPSDEAAWELARRELLALAACHSAPSPSGQ